MSVRAKRLRLALVCLHVPALAAVALPESTGAAHTFAVALAALAPVAAFFVGGLGAGKGRAADERRDDASKEEAGVESGQEVGGEAGQNVGVEAAKALGRVEVGREQRVQAAEQSARDLRAAFDDLGRGLLSVDAAGRLSARPSAALTAWFGSAEAGVPIWEYLEPNDAGPRDWMRLTWGELTADVMPIELSLDQLPTRLVRGDRSLQLEYRPFLEGDALSRMLVVVTDVTREVERERLEAEQRDERNVWQWVAKDRAGFAEFLDEGGAIVGRLAGRGARSKDEQLRLLHTLKGNCSLFGLGALTTLCHELEGRVVEAEGPLPPAELRPLAARWEASAARAHVLLGARGRPALELDEEDYEALRSAVVRSAGKMQLLLLLDDLRREPVARRLERMAAQTRAFAQRLGKGDIEVRTEPNRLRLPTEAWSGLWSALAHAVRNALDHGVESSDDRVRAGKAGAGRVTLRTRLADEPDFVDVEVEDDGRGVDWERVRQKAAAAGLPCESADDLHEALFHAGLSTKDNVDESSGRGAGMAALRDACEQLGGAVRVWSEPGQGTRVRARLPLHSEASVTSRRAQAITLMPSWAQDAGPLSRFATIDSSSFGR
ncbi:MAG: ATP-binding protein [Polyangiaceae bacterium]|nr:ATP-binding protein [Polyangiaceae bacterium]